MVIEKLPKDGASYSSVENNGTEITIGKEGNSITFNAAKYQTDVQNTVTAITHGAGERIELENASNAGVYIVASVVIPPEQFEIIEAEGETDEREEMTSQVIKMPVDMDAVKVILWPLPFEVEAKKEEEV